MGMGYTHLAVVLNTMCCLFATNAGPGWAATEDDLISSLLNGYVKDARPPQINKTTEVNMGLFLFSIDDVEEHVQTMTLSGYLLLRWSDRRLSWNSSQWKGIDKIVISADVLWKPDVALTDAVGDVFNSAFYSDYYGIAIDSSGNVTWTLYGSLSVRCDFDLRYYPFDVQTCDLTYESFNYPTYLLQLNVDFSAINLDYYHESSEFSIINTSALITTTHYEGDEKYSSAVFSMTIKRRQLYFMLNLILPCILLTTLTCFLFLLPVSSGERVSLSVTVMLSFSVFQLLVAQTLPMNSLYSPLLTVFILSAMFINGLSLILTILIMRTSANGSTPMPLWIEKYVVQRAAVAFGLAPKADASDLRLSPTTSKENIAADTVASLSEPALHALLNPLPDRGAVSTLLLHVRRIEELLRRKEESVALAGKWTIVGRVLDMILFMLFGLAALSLCLVCLVLMPAQSS